MRVRGAREFNTGTDHPQRMAGSVRTRCSAELGEHPTEIGSQSGDSRGAIRYPLHCAAGLEVERADGHRVFRSRYSTRTKRLPHAVCHALRAIEVAGVRRDSLPTSPCR